MRPVFLLVPWKNTIDFLPKKRQFVTTQLIRKRICHNAEDMQIIAILLSMAVGMNDFGRIHTDTEYLINE